MKVARLIRWFGLILCAVCLLLLAAFAWAWTRVKNSLPPLEGELPLADLSAPATLARDDQGIVTIKAATQADAIRALGFAHGQDRFFQMDLLRRRAAGELSALLGEIALPVDRASVVHRFRDLAKTALANEPAARREIFAAYTAGVNAGLASLPSAPWEYTLRRDEPLAWQPEDCFLVFYAMVLDARDSTGEYELNLSTIRDVMGAKAVDFFNPLIGPADSALDGSTAVLPPPPSPRVVDLRSVGLSTEPEEETTALPVERPSIGSNAWVLPGDSTTHTAALLAGDPHLPLGIPNIWYRASLAWNVPDDSPHRVIGASLPGVPGIIIGSNGHIAWSFTSALIDDGDLVAIDLNQVAPELLYHQGSKSLEVESHVDTIEVRGGEPETVESIWPVFGPIAGRNALGKSLAFKWVFHDPVVANFALLGLQTASDVESAIAASAGMPQHNIFVVDAQGNAAWTVIGKIPRRFGFNGRFPVSWTYGDRGWNGYLDASERPVVRAAPGQSLWSGNQRQIGGEALTRIGDSGFSDPERAAQIERGLAALSTPVTPADFLAIQLDDHATTQSGCCVGAISCWKRLIAPRPRTTNSLNSGV
ncbi:MAG: penicillin acylase family protein [Candidatus Synoicihabitans palmerolidicus]|nr:penicillin acylase family protein [Candidatus Synoicihabitans palmerolidicus]